MRVIADEYRNLRTFLLELPDDEASSSAAVLDRTQALWRRAHPEIARWFETEDALLAIDTEEKEDE
jgi:hypothetical protein